MRYMRASLLEVLNQDYVRTARAKGVQEFWVIMKHAVRNALLPVVTLIGSTIGIAVGGAIFIESVFNWPGMGLLLINAVEARDYPVIMGATLIIGACVIVVNLLTDIAYALSIPVSRWPDDARCTFAPRLHAESPTARALGRFVIEPDRARGACCPRCRWSRHDPDLSALVGVRAERRSICWP